MARTCVVKFAANRLTLPVSAFQVPAAPGTLAWPPRRPSTPTSRATVVTWSAKVASVSVILLMVSASAATSPFDFTVRFCLRSPLATAVTTFTIPRTCSVRLAAMTFTVSVRSFQVPATPGTVAWPPSLPSVPPSRATRVPSHRHLLREVAAGNRGCHLRDVADLGGEVRGHEVHVVGEVLPGARDARHLRLAAELAFGTDLARHARHLRGKRVKLIHHCVD